MKSLDLKTPTKIFKALSSQSSLKIFILLGHTKEACVSDIAKKIDLSMSATSHQLQKMEAAGLIDSWRDGRTICYVMQKNRLTSDLISCLWDLVSKKGRHKVKFQ